MSEQHIIVSGNPADGFTHIGPFDDPGDAIGWAEEHRRDVDWWVVTLFTPGDPEA